MVDAEEELVLERALEMIYRWQLKFHFLKLLLALKKIFQLINKLHVEIVKVLVPVQVLSLALVPIVVAKGMNLIAETIKSIGR